MGTARTAGKAIAAGGRISPMPPHEMGVIDRDSRALHAMHALLSLEVLTPFIVPSLCPSSAGRGRKGTLLLSLFNKETCVSSNSWEKPMYAFE